jgi:hypothetical protein
VWNKELIVPAAELFRFEIRGLNPDTAYTIYFAIGNPAVNPNYPIVPQNGIGFRTLDANTIEYAGSDTFPILGKDTTGLRVSVVLGASWHTTLSYVVRLGDGAWNANPAGKHSAETKREEMQGEGGRREIQLRQTRDRIGGGGGGSHFGTGGKQNGNPQDFHAHSLLNLPRPLPRTTHKLLSTQACLPRI